MTSSSSLVRRCVVIGRTSPSGPMRHPAWRLRYTRPRGHARVSSVSGRVPAVGGLCSVGVRLRALVLAALLATPVVVPAASEPPEQTITALPGDVQQRIDPLGSGSEQRVDVIDADGVQHVTEG